MIQSGRLNAAVAVLALAVAAGVAHAAQPPPTPAEVSVFQEGEGYVFRTAEDLALYTFDKDEPGRSNCSGPCAAAWPPVMAPAGAKAFAQWTTVPREGGLQWAYRGRPVYVFAKDTAASTAGDGLGGVWRLVKP